VGNNPWWLGIVQVAAGGLIATAWPIYVRFQDSRKRKAAFRAQARSLVKFASSVLATKKVFDQVQLLETMVERLTLVLYGPDAAQSLDGLAQEALYELPLLLRNAKQWVERAAPIVKRTDATEEHLDQGGGLTEDGQRNYYAELEELAIIQHHLGEARTAWTIAAEAALSML
jgi:hypothetical protein